MSTSDVITITQISDFALESYLATRRADVAEGNEFFMPPVVEAWRGGQRVATVFLVEASMEDLGMIAYSTTSLFRADAASLVSDSYVALSRINPKTKQEWVLGELGEYVEEYGTSKGVVADCVVAVAVNAAGDNRSVSQAYAVQDRVDGVGQELVLLQRDEFDSRIEEITAQGGPMAVLMEGMNTSEIVQSVTIAAQIADLPVFDAGVLADAVAAQLLMQAGCQVALSTNDPKYKATMERMTGIEMVENVEEAFKRGGH